jgi:hypothetical protein
VAYQRVQVDFGRGAPRRDIRLDTIRIPDSGSRMTTAAAIRIPDCHVLKDALHGPDVRA